MKRIRLFLGVACAVMLLLASSIPAFAMEFDAEQAYESIFVIYSGNYAGSGFAVGQNTVVTNAHVIGNSNDIVITTYNGEAYRASIYLIDNSFDIAVLSVDEANFAPLPIGNCDELKIGSDIYAIGAPKSMDYTLTKGVVSSKARTINGRDYIQIDAAINSGNSGGPLLNNVGEVVGVNSMKLTNAEGIGLAIPISEVISFIENNGVTVSEDNNVEGVIPYIENEIPGSSTSSEDGQIVVIQKAKNQALVTMLIVLLSLSVLLNIILIIKFLYTKNKNRDYIPDAKERTDFEIDILE